jgi:hypothetical protein
MWHGRAETGFSMAYFIEGFVGLQMVFFFFASLAWEDELVGLCQGGFFYFFLSSPLQSQRLVTGNKKEQCMLV